MLFEDSLFTNYQLPATMYALSMLVKDIMTKDVVCVAPETPVSMVARILYDRNFTGVPVVNERRELVGIVTEFDLMSEEGSIHIPTFINLLSSANVHGMSGKHIDKKLAEIRETKVRDIMTKEVVSVGEGTDIPTVAKYFTEKRINPIPVVDIHNRVVGIVGRADIVKLYKE